MPAEIQRLERFQDALKEVGNIGAGKASSELAKLLGRRININPPEIYLTPVKEVPNLVGGPQKMIVSVYTAVSGAVSGTVLVVLSKEQALQLTELIMKKKPGMITNLGKEEQLQLIKAGSALSTSYLKTITEFLELKVKVAPSRVVSTFGEALTDFVLLGIEESYTLVLKTTFNIPGTKIEGDFILLLAIESLTTLIEGLKKKT